MKLNTIYKWFTDTFVKSKKFINISGYFTKFIKDVAIPQESKKAIQIFSSTFAKNEVILSAAIKDQIVTTLVYQAPGMDAKTRNLLAERLIVNLNASARQEAVNTNALYNLMANNPDVIYRDASPYLRSNVNADNFTKELIMQIHNSDFNLRVPEKQISKIIANTLPQSAGKEVIKILSKNIKGILSYSSSQPYIKAFEQKVEQGTEKIIRATRKFPKAALIIFSGMGVTGTALVYYIFTNKESKKVAASADMVLEKVSPENMANVLPKLANSNSTVKLITDKAKEINEKPQTDEPIDGGELTTQQIGLSVPAIIGIAGGVILVIILIMFLMNRRRKR